MPIRSREELEELRLKVQKGLSGSIYKELAYRCFIFDFDMAIALREKRIPASKAIEAALQAIRGAGHVFLEYELVGREESLQATIGRLATFGMIQNITHLVEATKIVCARLEIKENEIKKSWYWDFRNDHTHIEREIKKGKKKDEEGKRKVFNIHEMPPEVTSFGSIKYASYSDDVHGYSLQTFSLDRGLRDLSFDLAKVFEASIRKINTPL
ncbi:protein of unknown function [Hyphomicrobium sp. MC1]|nr:protein of unknown function [Hyphomicrobium sp. MC1]